jgi:predicted lactoylglutathione lyase
MTSIKSVFVETPDQAAAESFYADAFGLDRLVHPRASEAPSSGFRGYTLSLIVSQPANVDAFLDAAVQAGATPLKPAKKQFWGGYSGVLRAPDGAIWKVATDAKKNTGPASPQIDGVVLLLGVADMRASKRFYLEHGLTVAKSFGSKYIEFDAASDAVKLGLYRRRALGKDANVTPEGSGSHRLLIINDAGSFTDPDGFAWQRTSAEH